MIDSATMRRDRLASRNRLTPKEIDDKSQLIHDRLLALEHIRDRHSIFVYVSFRSEVATFAIIDSLITLGKRVTVPITRVKEKRLDAIQITSLKDDLVPGYCDIPEPREELCNSQQVSPRDIESILLPGSVFDERGGRFGYGGGFYDRFLAANPAAARIGLAFDLQVVTKAPLQEHDELLDLVVTETRVIRGRR